MRKKKQTRSKTHSPRPISRKTTVQPRGATRRETRTLEQIQPRAQENHSTSNEGDRGGAKRGETYTLKQNQLRAQENHSTSNEGDRGGAKRGETHTLEQKETTTGLRKTEVKRVTNDLTDTAIGSPLTLEKTAPALRPKSFKKKRQIERQATLDTSNKTHGTWRFGSKAIVIPLTPNKKLE